uniref:Uncharacterized protein n=1 Tax=Oryza punctata TaxID=4537 RepID=A0A0E0JPJ2_ORYPU
MARLPRTNSPHTAVALSTMRMARRCTLKRRVVEAAAEVESTEGHVQRQVEYWRRGFWVSLKGKNKGSIFGKEMDFVQDLEDGGRKRCRLTTAKWQKATRRRRHGGGVVGADGVYFVAELEQQDGGDVSDVEQHLGDGLSPDSELQAGGGGQCRGLVLDTEDIYFVPKLELLACGDIFDTELHPDGDLFPDSEEQACGRGRRRGVVLGAEDIYFVPESELQGGGDVSDTEQHPDAAFIADSNEQLGGAVPDSKWHPNDDFFLDFEERVGGGVPNGEQQLDNGLFADLDDQQMDDVEELIDGEEVAILGDDDNAVAGDEGIDEFAETHEGMLRLLVLADFIIP